MFNIYKLLLITLLFSYENLVLTCENDLQRPIVSGIFKFNDQNLPDSLGVNIIPKFEGYSTFFKVNIDKTGAFQFRLQDVSDIKLIKMSYYNKSSNAAEDVGIYYVEPKDKIQMSIFKSSDSLKEGINYKKDSIWFSGPGSAKYNLIEALNKDYRTFIIRKNANYPSSFNVENIGPYLEFERKLVKEFSDKKEMLIRRFQEQVGSKISHIINFEYADYFAAWNEGMKYLYINSRLDDTESKKIIRTYYNHFRNQFFLKPDSLSVLSPIYVKSFATWYETNLILNSVDAKLDLKDYYNSLKNNSIGCLRESVLTGLFYNNGALANVRNFDQSIYDSLATDAEKFIISAEAKAKFIAMTRLKKGSRVFPGKFIYMNGKPFSIESLVGKVVFIDVWGNGCGACLAYHLWFKKNIWPIFKDRKDFVYLSISADSKKETWLQGVYRYSSEEYLNINTGGLGTIDHPMLKYYGIQETPFTMLVDKQGRVISKIDAGMGADDLISLINYGLNQ